MSDLPGTTTVVGASRGLGHGIATASPEVGELAAARGKQEGVRGAH
jgi:hypothetical protein